MCTLPGVGEDATSLEAHEVWLCNEGKKVAPNEEQIDVRMDATASRRLRNLSTMDVPSVKETYPYLMDARRVNIACVACHTSPYNILVCPFTETFPTLAASR